MTDVAHDDEQVIELEPVFLDLEKAKPGEGETKQPATTPLDTNEWLNPPMDLLGLAKLSQTNAARRSIIDAIARNTVGLGYSVSLVEGSEQDVKDQSNQQREIRNKLEDCAARDRRLDSPSLTELFMAVKTDEEEVGNGYIEVSRDKRTGLIDGLYHAPGKHVRRKKDNSGFGLLNPYTISDAVEFYHFGEKVKYDEKGQPTNALQGGKEWATNELLPFRIYSSESRDYGLPRDAGLVLEYTGDKLAAQSNISFFDSSGTPPTVIFVQGEERNDGGKISFRVPANLPEKIAGLLKSDGGHRHRVGIVPLPPGAAVNSVKLGEISERDMGFVEYRKDNLTRQLGAFRLSPIFISQLGDSGRYTAEVQRSISLEQVFDPEQQRWETRLHRTLLNDLGFPEHKVVFKRLAVENDAARRDSADKMAMSAAITNREYRKAHGYAPLPEAEKSDVEIQWEQDVWKSVEPVDGQVPHGWNDRLVMPPTKGREAFVSPTDPANSQQGLRPGIGARQRRQQTRDGVDVSAESQAQAMRTQAQASGDAATKRAEERAGVRKL